jgi:hypothetical protein
MVIVDPAGGPGAVAGAVVSRPALLERLSGPAQVTVVAAPAGSGKTVLLRSWLSRQELGGRAALMPVGFQNSSAAPELAFYAARSYSLMRPPRTDRRLIRSFERSAAG